MKKSEIEAKLSTLESAINRLLSAMPVTATNPAPPVTATKPGYAGKRDFTDWLPKTEAKVTKLPPTTGDGVASHSRLVAGNDKAVMTAEYKAKAQWIAKVYPLFHAAYPQGTFVHGLWAQLDRETGEAVKAHGINFRDAYNERFGPNAWQHDQADLIGLGAVVVAPARMGFSFAIPSVLKPATKSQTKPATKSQTLGDWAK